MMLHGENLCQIMKLFQNLLYPLSIFVNHDRSQEWLDVFSVLCNISQLLFVKEACLFWHESRVNGCVLSQLLFVKEDCLSKVIGSVFWVLNNRWANEKMTATNSHMKKL